MPRHLFDDEEDLYSDPPLIEVEITDPNVLGYLLGPDGEPIATLLDRSTVTFGFQPGGVR